MYAGKDTYGLPTVIHIAVREGKTKIVHERIEDAVSRNNISSVISSPIVANKSIKFSNEQVLQWALQDVGNYFDYHFTNNNCETWLIEKYTGSKYSDQIESFEVIDFLNNSFGPLHNLQKVTGDILLL